MFNKCFSVVACSALPMNPKEDIRCWATHSVSVSSGTKTTGMSLLLLLLLRPYPAHKMKGVSAKYMSLCSCLFFLSVTVMGLTLKIDFLVHKHNLVFLIQKNKKTKREWHVTAVAKGDMILQFRTHLLCGKTYL